MADPKSPFPPEVVARAKAAFRDIYFSLPPGQLKPWREGVEAVLSVLADYLRSDEVRERVADAIYRATAVTYTREGASAADAVIAAMLGEKTCST